MAITPPRASRIQGKVGLPYIGRADRLNSQRLKVALEAILENLLQRCEFDNQEAAHRCAPVRFAQRALYCLLRAFDDFSTLTTSISSKSILGPKGDSCKLLGVEAQLSADCCCMLGVQVNLGIKMMQQCSCLLEKRFIACDGWGSLAEEAK